MMKNWADLVPSADGSVEIRAYSLGAQAGWNDRASKAGDRHGMTEFLLP
jgi:hypothetical protein